MCHVMRLCVCVCMSMHGWAYVCLCIFIFFLLRDIWTASLTAQLKLKTHILSMLLARGCANMEYLYITTTSRVASLISLKQKFYMNVEILEWAFRYSCNAYVLILKLESELHKLFGFRIRFFDVLIIPIDDCRWHVFCASLISNLNLENEAIEFIEIWQFSREIVFFL